MAMEFSSLYTPLLDWVYEQAGGSPSTGVDLTPFAVEHGFTEREAFDLLTYGKIKGGLDNRLATLGEPAANLTALGLDLAEQSRRRRTNPVERSKAARRSLLQWLWTKNEEGARFPFIKEFVDTRDSVFAGSQLTADEIDRAAGYLKTKGLIDGRGAWGSQGPLRAEITAEGQDCVENFDADPSANDRGGAVGTIYNTYLPNAQGVIVGEQQHFAQNNTTGLDPSAFVQLAGYVGQISNTLGMTDPDRGELERVAQELHAEATSQAPEPGRLRQLAGQIKDRLLDTGATMAATVGIQMAEKAVGALMQ